jgi:hypothetical protein
MKQTYGGFKGSLGNKKKAKYLLPFEKQAFGNRYFKGTAYK